MRTHPPSRHGAVAVVATVAALLALTACQGAAQPGAGPSATSSTPAATPTPTTPPGGPVIKAFAAAWPGSGKGRFRGITDAPQQTAKDIATYDGQLGSTGTKILLAGDLRCAKKSCTEHASVTQQIPGAAPWTYRTLITSAEAQHTWRVHWRPSTFVPGLTSSRQLTATRVVPPRAPILGAGGIPLTPVKPVYRVGVVPKKVTPTTYTDLVNILGVDAATVRAAVKAAQPDWFVPVIDLRKAPYEKNRSAILKVPGILVEPQSRALAPSPIWARALLGVVQPATAAALKNAGPYTLPTDQVGIDGLQAQYQKQLAGTPGLRVNLVNSITGEHVKTLLDRAPVPGTSLATTIDKATEDAVERVVAGARQLTSVVVVQASTGKILAVANTAPGPTSFNTAFVGRYAPGSAFKTIGATAMMYADPKLTATSVGNCPPETFVGGTQYHNDRLGMPAHPTLGVAFAISCNTFFITQETALPADALPKAATRIGFGATWKLGTPAFSGSIPASSYPAMRAANAIGQGQVLASPLAMAMVAAALDSGVVRTPTLLPKSNPGQVLGHLPQPVVKTLHTLMRMAVTIGTAKGVNVPGLPVYAKTGTPEFQGPDGKLQTNGWMMAFRGDIAVAVFVGNGKSGAQAAGPVIANLFTALPSSLYR